MLEHGDRKGLSLKGEANQLSADDIANQRKAFKAKLKLLSEEHGVKLPCIYNADQTGLYYRKLPNRMFVSPEKRKKARGTKLMKDKDRITVMVCVAADGSQQPLCVVGTAIEPRCFKSLTDWHKQLTVQGTPCFYTNQSKAWFDTTVTLWWFNTVFLPAHRKKHGGAIAILLLDNFKAHKKALPEGKAHGGQVYVLYFPENMTAVIQPCDMGLINGLKCGYKVDLLHRALELADDPEALARALESAKLLQKSLGQGSQGIDDGHKANVLDAMFILEKIWTGDRHCQPRAVSNCWRKSNCLPQELEEALEDCADETRDYTKLNDKDLERFCAVFNTIEISAAVENPAPLFENIQLAHNQPALEPAEANNIFCEWVRLEDLPDQMEEEADLMHESALKSLIAGSAGEAPPTFSTNTTQRAPSPEPANIEPANIAVPDVSKAECEAALLQVSAFINTKLGGHKEAMMLHIQLRNAIVRARAPIAKKPIQASIAAMFSKPSE